MERLKDEVNITIPREDGPGIIFARKWAVTLENVQFFFEEWWRPLYGRWESDQTLFYLCRGQLSGKVLLSHLVLFSYVNEKNFKNLNCNHFWHQRCLPIYFSKYLCLKNSNILTKKLFFWFDGNI